MQSAIPYSIHYDSIDTKPKHASHSRTSSLRISRLSSIFSHSRNSSSSSSSSCESQPSVRKFARDRIQGWRKGTSPKEATPHNHAAQTYTTLHPMQCTSNSDSTYLQQRDATDPRSLAFQVKKYNVSDCTSIRRRERPIERPPSTNTSYSLTRQDSTHSYTPSRPSRTRQNPRPTSVFSASSSSYTPSFVSLTHTVAQPSATAASIPCSSPSPQSRHRRQFSSASSYSDYSGNMYRTYTGSSRTTYVPPNPVSSWDDDDDDEPRKRSFLRFNSRQSSSRPSSSRASKAPSIRSVNSQEKREKNKFKSEDKRSKASIANKFGIDDLGDAEWSLQGYLDDPEDESNSDAEIEAALRKMRMQEEAEAAQTKPSTPPSPSPLSIPVPVLGSSRQRSSPSPLSSLSSSAQSYDLSSSNRERFENEILSFKKSSNPVQARDQLPSRLRKAVSRSPSTPLPDPKGYSSPSFDMADSWKYTSTPYQITPPDSTRSSHVYIDRDSHHSLVLPESPVLKQPLTETPPSSYSSTSEQRKWSDISANIALIQQQIQDLSPRSRDNATRGYVAKELSKPAVIPPPTLQSLTTPSRPSRENVELPDLYKSYLSMGSASPSALQNARRPRRPTLYVPPDESDSSRDPSLRSLSVSTGLSTAPSSPDLDLRYMLKP